MKKRLLFIVNVDWYFLLHWMDRAKQAINEGYEVYVAVSVTASESILTMERSGLTVHPLKLSRKGVNPARELGTFLQVYRIIKKIKPDVVHTATIKPNFYGGFICRLLKIPIVATVPGMGGVFVKDTFYHRALQRCFLSFYSLCFNRNGSVLFFENADDLAYVKSKCIISKGRIQKIPGAGIDINIFKSVKEPEHSVAKILFASRLYKDKGLQILIDAVEEVRAKGVSVDLLVAGIFDRDALDVIPEAMLSNWATEGKLRWLGQVKDMSALISSVNIVCQPSIVREGLPRIILEAMACSRAVITTDLPGCREGVRHGVSGLVVPPGDFCQLAEAIMLLVDNAELRGKFGEAGRVLVEDEYSNEQVFHHTFTAYKYVLACQH